MSIGTQRCLAALGAFHSIGNLNTMLCVPHGIDGIGNGIRARQRHLLALTAKHLARRAFVLAQLFDDLVHLDTRAQAQRDQARNRVDVRLATAARIGEHFEDVTALCAIDCDVHRGDAG